MQRKVRKIENRSPMPPSAKRVAAYARVSSEKDEALKSLSAQVSHYSEYIQRHRGWQYAGVYTDEALTGTRDDRPQFQRLLTDCREGRIDMIITKSISRFARNTVTLLETVRELKLLGIDVYFEKEGIHSMSGDGELMLTILASFAQEESRSVSENCKWRIRHGFKAGQPHGFSILGYRLEGRRLTVVPEEAEIVRMIFADYLNGMGKNAIMKKLNAAGIKTKRGNQWLESTVDRILRNEKYAGDLLLQKVYIVDHMDKKKKANHGVLPRYYVQSSHEGIVDRETFNKVQERLNSGAARYHPDANKPAAYSFSGKIVCGQCGKNYRRKMNNAGTKYARPVWICSTFNSQGKTACPSRQIPEDILHNLIANVLGLTEFDEETFQTRVERMRVPEAGKIELIFKDGHEVLAAWQHRSRSESWDAEARERARVHRNKRQEGREQP